LPLGEVDPLTSDLEIALVELDTNKLSSSLHAGLPRRTAAHERIEHDLIWQARLDGLGYAIYAARTPNQPAAIIFVVFDAVSIRSLDG